MNKFNKYDIIVLEGYEMTGKTYYIEQLQKKIHNCISYMPNWNVINDKILSRGNRYAVGLSVIDFFSRLNLVNSKLILDRWVASSYAYKKFYNQSSDFSNLDDLVESVNKSLQDKKILFIHKCHKDIDMAKKMYNLSVVDANHSDLYDKFENFDSYYDNYLEFEKLFNEFYDKSKFEVIKVNSYTEGDINDSRNIH